MLCPDDANDLSIYGDWNTDEAQSVHVYLNKCQGYDYCKTDEEIKEFFRGKYMLLLNN